MPARKGSARFPANRNKRQPLSNISSNTVFIACNFNNRRVKGHFDELKRKWESTLPLRVYLSDRIKGKGARDLWKDISQTIEEANLAIFDVTSFRPNVVLELGYSLALKQPEHMIICRDLTPSGKKTKRREKWLLSDIPHLNRIEYMKFKELDEKLVDHVELMAPVRNFYRLTKDVERQRGLSKKAYVSESVGALQKLRDTGPMRRSEFRSFLEERGLIARVNPKRIEELLKKHKLAKPASGRRGCWKLID